ncbi:MAG: SDR family NAD(P)-dependent oxidoreductase [Gemmatimonadota bacterium]
MGARAGARGTRTLAALVLGAAVGATTAAAAALLLYTTKGFLGTAGFLIGLALAALGLGLWVGAEAAPDRRRWVAVVVANAAAAIFAWLWTREAEFRESIAGGALAAFFLLAQPAYTAGSLFTALARRARGAAAPALFGASLGVLAAAVVLIPRVQPGVIFVLAAAVLLVVAPMETRRPLQSMTTNFSLTGTCALVTGVGDRGQVGFAIAQRLIEAGARVCITDVRAEVAAIARELGAYGVQIDLTNEDDVARLVRTAIEQLGRLDLLVNVAGGLSVIKPLADTARSEWERELRRNADTVFMVSRAALPALRKRGGAIVNFAAPAGLRAMPQLGAYSAAKAAVVAFTRALAIEEKEHGVRVNALAPGMIDTEQNRRAMPDNTKWVSREQIANVVLFLASDAGSGITGETVHVLGQGIE